ncbi:S8 family serine peptidase [Actinoplanes sp. NPDC051851]|uniref:S8 family serine peptidase n=1 Tax=Actinoplanes sp. NPDC051851 TaxID=3154753 RepID=UPI00342FCD02
MNSARKARALLVSGVMLAGLVVAAPALAAPAEGEVRGTGGPGAVAGSYIVVLEDGAGDVAAQARALAGAQGGGVVRTYTHALRGFEATLTEQGARRLAADPAVASVTQNHLVHASDVGSWGLDRIDQRALPLDGAYAAPNDAAGVTAYIIDSGVNLTHTEFAGRVRSGWDFVDGDADASDCLGHGTHVAGTVGGTTYGVAKDVQLVSVRVLDCAGSGSAATVIAGVDWVTADHAAGAPAVATMSLGGTGVYAAEITAVQKSIADGVTYAIAAGNDYGGDACGSTPAATPEAITVGAVEADDTRSDFSNIGSCVDVFAPGRDIVSAYVGDDTATHTYSGTSMATPHVAGAAALILADHPEYTPAQVATELLADATPDAIPDPGTGSPNRLLYVDQATPADDYALAVATASGPITAGGTVTATVSAALTAGAAQQIALSASGLPAGVTATFAPASITTGGTSTLTVATTAKTAAGTYHLLVLGTGTSATRAAYLTVTVAAAPGCVGTNDTDTALPAVGYAYLPVTIAGCTGTGAVNSTVEVHLDHAYIGDLVVDLVAPDGTAYHLIDRTGSSADDLDYTFTHDLSPETADGAWTLRIQDNGPYASGVFDSWTLNLAGEDLAVPVCGGASGTDYAIADRATVESPITVSDCDRSPAAKSYVEVRIVEPSERNLTLYLIAPDGERIVLQQTKASGTADVFRTYLVLVGGKSANGVWILHVEDQITGGAAGYLDHWKLTL